MNAVDEFVVYDNIEYTKKGWINRNRILVNGKDSYITIPMKKDSDYLDIRDRYLAETWPAERLKMLNRINASYRKAQNFASAYPVVEKIILFDGNNLFAFLLNSLTLLKDYLGIRTSLLLSSEVPVDHKLKAEKKVIEICKARKANIYVNPIGGTTLYRKDYFKAQGIDLFFLNTHNLTYKQFNNDFVALLSIVDVMMFNSKETINEYLTSFYSLI